MAVSLNDICAPALAILNASTVTAVTGTNYGVNDFFKRYSGDATNPGLVRDLAIDADEEICLAIIQTDGHPLRSKFKTTSSGLAHGAAIPINYGILTVLIDGFAAEPLPTHEIAMIRRNKLALNTIAVGDASNVYRYYSLEDGAGRIFHTGTSAVLDMLTFTRSAANPPVPQQPDGFVSIAIARTVGRAFGVDGVRLDAAAAYNNFAEVGLQMIRAGKVEIPPIELLQAQIAQTA